MSSDYSTHPLGSPGSPKAISNGCKCPVLDNAHGKGIGGDAYWINGKCKIHNNPENTLPLSMAEFETMPIDPLEPYGCPSCRNEPCRCPDFDTYPVEQLDAEINAIPTHNEIK